MYYDSAEAGVVVLSYQDLTRQEAEDEPTGMYWWRVLVRQYHRPGATPAEFGGTALAAPSASLQQIRVICNRHTEELTGQFPLTRHQCHQRHY